MVKCEPTVAAVDHSPIQGGAALLKAEVYMYLPMESTANHRHVSEIVTVLDDSLFNQSRKATLDTRKLNQHTIHVL
jgi:hypothetical protein